MISSAYPPRIAVQSAPAGLARSAAARRDRWPAGLVTDFDRLETKYALAPGQVEPIVAALSRRLRPDVHGSPEGHYQVVSLYFDNAERDVYMDHVRRTDLRRKLRVRVYRAAGCPPLSFVEIKQRLGERTAKRRAAMPLASALAACAGRLPAASPADRRDARVIGEAALLAASRRLEPACLVRYDRQALVGGPGEPDLRVTVDRNIRYRSEHLLAVSFDLPFAQTLLDPGAAILEIKVGRAVPGWLGALLEAQGPIAKGDSKYAQIVERTR